MKRVLVIALCTALSGLAGCASTGSASLSHENSMKVDAAYVTRVEAIARQRGVAVQWVNPPRLKDRHIAQR